MPRSCNLFLFRRLCHSRAARRLLRAPQRAPEVGRKRSGHRQDDLTQQRIDPRLACAIALGRLQRFAMWAPGPLQAKLAEPVETVPQRKKAQARTTMPTKVQPIGCFTGPLPCSR